MSRAANRAGIRAGRYTVQMIQRISHDRAEETIEAKARWFQSLPITERMELLCSFTDLALTQNPDLADRKKNAQPADGRIRVISPP